MVSLICSMPSESRTPRAYLKFYIGASAIGLGLLFGHYAYDTAQTIGLNYFSDHKCQCKSYQKRTESDIIKVKKLESLIEEKIRGN
jgi:hypothetical protein